MNIAVAARPIGIALPILERGCMEIKGTATQSREVRNGGTRFTIAHVLQDVIAHDQIELTRCGESIERTLFPAVARAQVLAHFHAEVSGARQGAQQRLTHESKPATRIENALHRYIEITNHG